MNSKFKNWLINKRFDLLFYALVFLVFHPLILTPNITHNFGLPFSIMLVFLTSYLLFLQSTRRKQMALILFYVFLFSTFLFFSFVIKFETIQGTWIQVLINLLFLSYFVLVFYQLMTEIFRDNEFDIDMIFGSLSGFILLNMISSFLFIITDHIHPNSFKGIDTNAINIFDEYLYHSFVTLTSIGYGDIVPTTLWAKKMVMLTGTLGQFYIIVVVSLVVGKFASMNKSKE